MSSETIKTVTKNLITIEYMGKTVDKELVVPGLVKAGNAYLVKCSRSGEWTYCNEERLAKLTAKYGTVENVGTKYVGRNGKQSLKKEVAAAKAAADAIAAANAPTPTAPVVPAEPPAETATTDQAPAAPETTEAPALSKRQAKKAAKAAIEAEKVAESTTSTEPV